MSQLPNLRSRRVFSSLILLLALLLTLVPMQPVLAAGNAWTNVGSLATQRYAHTVTLLPNGLLLALGGHGIESVGAVKTVEVYNPATKTWSNKIGLITVGSMLTARYNHTATLLSNGKVLVVGGMDNLNKALASAELFDPATGKWVSAGTMSAARVHHTATLLSNGQVLIAGGYNAADASLKSAELYNPVSGWSTTGSMTGSRDNHAATWIPSIGKVLVVGGESIPDSVSASAETFGMFLNEFVDTLTGSPALVSAELYDPVAKTWKVTGSLTNDRKVHTATLLKTGLVLVTGGFGRLGAVSASELYNPSTGHWVPTTALSIARYYHTATLLGDGTVIVIGGLNAGTALRNVETYNPANAAWTQSTLITGRSQHTTTFLPSTLQILIAGGYGGSGELSSTQLFGPMFSISGKAPAGAKLSYTDGVAKYVLANASGVYTLPVIKGWSGRVTVSKTGVPSFRPVYYDYTNVIADVTGKNYLPNVLFTAYSNATYDGQILESTETSNKGGTLNSTATSFVLGDDIKDREYRGILSFDTNALPNTARILSASIRMVRAGGTGINPFTRAGNTLYIDIRKVYYGLGLKLELADFTSFSNLNAAGSVSATPVSGYYYGKLSTLGLAQINLIGNTQMRLRYRYDDNDNMRADWFAFYSGNVATAAYKPQLSIVYYIP
ncbi:MAG: kelch repeat-containing protein [Chloroflexota bacterium]